MSEISSWLLSITGIILLSILSEFVLPEGQINKYTKIIFSFVILLVIILPLPKLFGKDFNLSNFLNYNDQLQEEYLEQVNLDKLTAISDTLSKSIEEQGLKKVEVSINANIFSEKLEIYGIYVDLCDIEYDKTFGNKDITKAKLKILEIIEDFSMLNGVEVKFNE